LSIDKNRSPNKIHDAVAADWLFGYHNKEFLDKEKLYAYELLTVWSYRHNMANSRLCSARLYSSGVECGAHREIE